MRCVIVWCRLAVGVALTAAVAGGALARSEFPFGKELFLDTRPMKGSKRIPIIEVAENGAAAIDLWCNSVQAQLVVVNDTITVLTGQQTDRACPPERARGDQEIMDALQQVTNWRREGDSVVLIGPRTLRFRLPTH
jgi:heat shock protein HslJ